MSGFHFARQASFWLASAALLASYQPAAAQGQVTVYCSILEEQCREGATMFERATGIKVSMVRKSTGEVYAPVSYTHLTLPTN